MPISLSLIHIPMEICGVVRQFVLFFSGPTSLAIGCVNICTHILKEGKKKNKPLLHKNLTDHRH
jgi:hypothetical protein